MFSLFASRIQIILMHEYELKSGMANEEDAFLIPRRLTPGFTRRESAQNEESVLFFKFDNPNCIIIGSSK